MDELVDSQDALTGLLQADGPSLESLQESEGFSRGLEKVRQIPDVHGSTGAMPLLTTATEVLSASPGATGESKLGKTKNLVHAQNIGDYEIQCEIGRGGMGNVYKAIHTKLQRPVALKVLSSVREMHRNSILRFEREMLALGRLQHPNIIVAHDASVADGVHYLVMDYVDGPTLNELVAEKGPLCEAEALAYLVEVCEGLNYAHVEGVIHRDIKPGNLMLAPDGSIKILDLGLARLISAPIGAPLEITESEPEFESDVWPDQESLDDSSSYFDDHLTQDGEVIGTLAFIAPEQLANAQRADARADVFGVGATLWFMLTGTIPSFGDVASGEFVKNREELFSTLRDVRPDISEQLASDFSRMVATDPVERFQSMADLLATLRKHRETAQSIDSCLPQAAVDEEQAGTDSVEETAARKQSENKREGKRFGWPLTMTAAVSLLALLAIVLIIRDRNGNEVSRLTVKNGNSVAIEGDARVTSTKTKTSTTGMSRSPLPGLLVAPKTIEAGRWQVITRLPTEIGSIDANRSGKMIAVGDGTLIRIYERDQRELHLVKCLLSRYGAVTSVNWSPDDRFIAATCDGPEIQLWDVASGIRIQELKGHRDTVTDIDWGPDSKSLASVGQDGTIRIWNINGKLVRVEPAHTGIATSVAWNPRKQLLACGGEDGTVSLWNTDLKRVNTLQNRAKGRISSLSWSPDGERLAVGSWDNSIYIAMADGSPSTVIAEHTDFVFDVAWSQDGKMLASASADNSIRDWKVGDDHSSLRGRHDGNAVAVRWMPSDSSLISAGKDGSLRLWSSGDSSEILLSGRNAVTTIAWSPDGKWFAIGLGSGDPNIRLFSRQGRQVGTLKGHKASILSLAWSPDGKRIASSSSDGTARVWNWRKGTAKVLAGHTGDVSGVAWSPVDDRLATGGYDGTIRIWSADGEELKKLIGHQDKVRSVAWNPTGESLASASWDGTARLWNLSKDSFETLQVGFPLVFVNWRSDGKLLATCCTDGTTQLWSKGGKLVSQLEGHLHASRTADWDNNAYQLATAGWDGTVRLWAQDGSPSEIFQGHSGYVNAAQWHPYSKRILSGGSDATVRLWNPSSQTTEWVVAVLPHDGWATFDSHDQLIEGTPDVVKNNFVCILELSTGAAKLFEPTDFHEQFGQSVSPKPIR